MRPRGCLEAKEASAQIVPGHPGGKKDKSQRATRYTRGAQWATCQGSSSLVTTVVVVGWCGVLYCVVWCCIVVVWCVVLLCVVVCGLSCGVVGYVVSFDHLAVPRVRKCHTLGVRSGHIPG